MMAENCAESAITEIPQMRATSRSNTGEWKTSAATMQQAELTAMEITVTRARWAILAVSMLFCRRSLATPAQMQPTAPTAMTKVVSSSDFDFDHPLDAATMTAIHPHMEYSSHIWPRYPRLARRSGRLRTISPIWERSRRDWGMAYGPSRTASATTKAAIKACTLPISTTARQGIPP